MSTRPDPAERVAHRTDALAEAREVASDRRTRRRARKRLARGALAAFMVSMGALHFVAPEPFVRAMPPYLPWHLQLVYLSGACELAGGLGLLHPRLRVAAGWGLVLLLVAVFPANVHMALHGLESVPAWLLWARLPFQAPLIAWAWSMTRPEPPA